MFTIYSKMYVIVSAYRERNNELDGVVKVGLSRQDIMRKHNEVYGRLLPDWQLRQQIIPPLETAGLISQESDPLDKRRLLIYPTVALTISNPEQNNSESDGGVQVQEEYET